MNRLAAQLVGTLLLVGLVGAYFWWIAGIVLAVVVWRLAPRGLAAWRRWQSTHRAAAAAEADRQAAIVARADEQHNWVMQGDERGMYGRYPPAAI